MSETTKKEYLLFGIIPLFKKEKSYFYTKYYFLGIKIWHKNKSKVDILADKISDLQNDVQGIKSGLQHNFQTIQDNVQILQHNINSEIKSNFQSLKMQNLLDYFPVESKSDVDVNTEENRYIEPIQTSSCKICGGEAKLLFKSKIFHNRYDAEYYYCPNCGFLQAEKLEWLEESYNTPVTQEDTGVLLRNLSLRKYISIILFNLINPNGRYLDYGGGYGLLTRLLRDIGFEFYHYDKYCENIVAQGFEGSLTDRYDAVTSIEAFEHFVNPLQEIEQMLKLTDTILFTEEILPLPAPEPSEWWYYCLNHGQHISFYSNKTFQFIANKYGLNYYNVYNLHILSKQNFEAKINYLKTKSIDSLFSEVEMTMQSLTVKDMNYIIELTNKQ